MKVSVTGSNGFIGRALCNRLEEDGHEVVRVVRSQDGHSSISIGDIGPDTDWSRALSGVDCVIHCAARVHVMNAPKTDALKLFREVNVAGTRRLAEQAAEMGVRRMVFLSSVKVNGESTVTGTPFAADMPVNPQDPYGISKLEAEQSLWEVSRQTGLEVVIVRPPLVYGPGVKGNFASLVRWVRKGIPLPLASVDNLRSLVALDNLTSFIALCTNQEKSPMAANQVFLISDGEDVSTSELLHKIAQAYGSKIRLFSVPVSWMQFAAGLLGKRAIADRLLGSLQVDSSRAHELLNWRPEVTIDAQLKKMAQHDTDI